MSARERFLHAVRVVLLGIALGVVLFVVYLLLPLVTG